MIPNYTKNKNSMKYLFQELSTNHKIYIQITQLNGWNFM